MDELLRQSLHGQTNKRCTTVLHNNLPIRTKQATNKCDIHLISSINVIYEITGDHYGLSMCTEWCQNSNYSHNLCTEID
jgi:hypothetical protein